MENLRKNRKIVVFSAVAAVGLSATTIVTQHASTPLNTIQSALRDGASVSKVNPDKPGHVRVARMDRG
jgi:hypothetical protein